MLAVSEFHLHGLGPNKLKLGGNIQEVSGLIDLNNNEVPFEMQHAQINYKNIKLNRGEKYFGCHVEAILIGYNLNNMILTFGITVKHRATLVESLIKEFGQWKTAYRSEIGESLDEVTQTDEYDFYLWEKEAETITLSIDKCNSPPRATLVFKSIDLINR